MTVQCPLAVAVPFYRVQRRLCLRCPHTVGHIRLKDSRQLVDHIHRVIKAYALVGLPKRDVKRRRGEGNS